MECFYVDLLCPLISGRCNGRVNDGYSTMSDGIFDGIFPIVHRTFLLSHSRGCWLLDFSCVQSMWTVRAHFGQSNFSFFQQKWKKEILLILIIFTYFKVRTKIEKKKMVRKIDHFFIFLILKSASKIQKIL